MGVDKDGVGVLSITYEYELCYRCHSSSPGSTVYVTDFGAVPDDGIDDRAALIAAMSTGGIVMLPVGQLDCYSDFWMPSDVTLRGVSGSILRMHDSTLRMANISNVGLVGFELVGDGPQFGGPTLISMHENVVGMLLAGIWDSWQQGEGDTLLSFAVLTCEANEHLAFVHKRQPVMLGMEDARTWLDPSAEASELKALCASRVPVPLDAVPVSSYGNNARNKDARCTEAIGKAVAIAEDATP